MTARFDWNPAKDRENQLRHGVSFAEAQLAFADPRRVIVEDLEHSEDEPRFFCFGRVGNGNGSPADRGRAGQLEHAL